MKKEDIKTMTFEEAIHNKEKGKTDWEALRRDRAAGIDPEPNSDEGEIDWSRIQVLPRPKQPVSVRSSCRCH